MPKNVDWLHENQMVFRCDTYQSARPDQAGTMRVHHIPRQQLQAVLLIQQTCSVASTQTEYWPESLFRRRDFG